MARQLEGLSLIIKNEMEINYVTQVQLSEELGITTVSINQKLKNNFWRKTELYYMENKLKFRINGGK